jgi:hypothetical protein
VRLALIVALMASVARAQAPSEAEQLFRQGRRAMESGNFAEASDRFRDSLRHERTAGALFNLAACEEQLGKVLSASRDFREAATLLQPDDERRQYAEDHATQLAGRIPELVVRSENAHASLGVDGERVIAGELHRLEPGTHVLTVEAAGSEPVRLQIDLRPGEHKEIVVPAQRPSVAPTPAPHRNVRRPLGIALLTLGGAGLAAGAAAGFAWLANDSTVQNHCSVQIRACDAPGLDAVGTANTLFQLGWSAGTIGAALAIAGSGLLISTARKKSAVAWRR